jgi:pimeloyl-ACP methyl ester carboxylesterase
VIAAANPLQGLAADAEAVSDVVRSVDGPILLVAHSYGGAVISNVAADAPDLAGAAHPAPWRLEGGPSLTHA